MNPEDVSDLHPIQSRDKHAEVRRIQEAGITRDERGKWNVETTTEEKNR